MSMRTGSRRAPAPASAAARSRPPWRMLAVVLCGQAMASMDSSVVNVALPTIRRDLPATGGQAQLVPAAYLLGFAAVVVTGARLGDRFGRVRMFRLGLAAFTVASVVCGLAPGATTLIVARTVQGAAGAIMAPQVLSLIVAGFSGRAQARAIGLYSMVLAIGVAAGQILGGLLVTADLQGLGWRPALLINLPAGVALLVAGRALPADGPPAVAHLDLPGALLLGASVAAVVAPLTLGRERGWPAGWLALLGAGIAGVLLFGGYQHRLAGSGRSALLDLRAVRPPGVRAGLTACFLVMGAYAALIFTLTLYLQAALHFSALRAGLTFVPFAAGFATVSLVWTRLTEVAHRVLPVAGPLAFAGAALAVVVLARHGWPTAAAPLLLYVAGAGHAASFSPLFARLGRLIGAGHGSALSALGNTGALLAGAVSIAALGGLYLSAGRPYTGLVRTCLAIDALLLVTAACAAWTVTRRPPASG